MRLGRVRRRDREPAPCDGSVCHGRGGERRHTGSGSRGWTERACAFDRPPVSPTPGRLLRCREAVMVDVRYVSKRATRIRATSAGLRAFGQKESGTMKSAITRLAFGAAFGLIVSAVGISMMSEQAWADSCAGTTIGHRNSDCLTAAYSNNRQTLSLTNECSSLGVVTAEVKTHNNGPEGLVTGLIELSNSTPWVYTILREHGIYTNARCCTTSGVCAITDCDTTNGVINDSSTRRIAAISTIRQVR